jgi:predicted nucleic acid-binding Zn ribbon protein
MSWKAEKTISRTSFQLKGSGWYVTDYSRKASAGNAEGAATKNKTEKTPEKKSESVTSTAASSDSD